MELREFIALLDKRGFLKRVCRIADWKYEIGEMARKERSWPLLFENIRDYPGCRLFTGGLSRTGFLALNLGLESLESRKKLIRILNQRMQKPLEPLESEKPVDYHIKDTDEVNLYELPVPWWNVLDGGRYIGTWHLNITHDPLSGKRNAGVYRMQIVNRNQTTVSASPHSHLAMNMRNAEKLGKDLEMAVAIGVDEALVFAAASAVPHRMDEFSFAGALLKKPVKLRCCKRINMKVPFDAEYVLEGVIKKGTRVTDGPYLDYTGKPSINPSAYLFEVKSVARRPDAIFRGMSVGMAGAEDHQLFSILSALNLADFHGSALRQRVQNFFLKRRMFSLFQLSGRLGSYVNMKRFRQQRE